MDLSEFCVVQTTIDDEAAADKIAAALVEKKLAACVQVAQVTSHYVWKGVAAREQEYLLNAKARRADLDLVSAAIRKLHSYELPEIIAIPLLVLEPVYLDWARRATERG
jgi:periplasmic divalent cation tolerance protein